MGSWHQKGKLSLPPQEAWGLPVAAEPVAAFAGSEWVLVLLFSSLALGPVWRNPPAHLALDCPVGLLGEGRALSRLLDSGLFPLACPWALPFP